MRRLLLLCVAAVLLPHAASAKSHLWKFTEVFSNADGSVQFIEMFVFDPAGTQEWFFAGQRLESNDNVFIFPTNLPQVNTFHTWVLIATPAFAALPGAPTPDYTIPANFFDPAGDELRYRTTLDILPLPAGAVPVDGLHSYLRNGTTDVNSPTNFAGDEGSIDLAPCDDGLDNDGDGRIDLGPDPGCASAIDPDGSERDSTGTYPCDDDSDNDADGDADHPDDPGCHDPGWIREDPQCQDGTDNEGDGRADFDGGQSIHGACSGGVCPPGVTDPNDDGVADPDPACVNKPFRNKETAGCGLGFELALLMAGLGSLRGATAGRARRDLRRPAGRS